MSNLAIRGHPTRGKEVIEILEILGGCNKHNYTADCDSLCFYISTGINIIYYDWVNNCCEDKDILVFTLEEFLQKYPYMVGDKVIYHECEAVVTSMEWNGDEVSYTVLHKGIKWQTTVFYLQPYKEETMEENPALASDLIRQDCSGKIFGYKIPNGYEFDCIKNNEIILKLKQPEYPKTYEGCCKVLDIQSDWHLTFNSSASCDLCINKEFEYVCKLEAFRKLLICRDAYWKIAGDWKFDFDKECFYICNEYGSVQKYEGTIDCNAILTFPTKEMRDAFYENFEELIKECKEFL
jgi:hypothetical protein